MTELPSGTVTFVFTDIEGSTRLLKQLGRDRYETMVAEHAAILRTAFLAHDGRVVDSQGDSFFVAFHAATDAVVAAVDAQRKLVAHEWPDGMSVKVRMGLHSGEPKLGGDRYFGIGVHRAARIGAVAHGGQVLLSSATRELVEDDLPDGILLRDLDSYRLKDIDRPERISQLVAEGLSAEFPPLPGATPSGSHGTMRYGILGPLELSDEGRSIGVRSAKQRALLAMLLLNANQVVSSDGLIEALWEEQAPETAGKALQVHVSQLRKLLGPGRLLTRSPGYVLNVDEGELDVSEFEVRVRRARNESPAEASAALQDALSLWRGAPLADFAFDRFAQRDIARLEELRLEVTGERIEADLACGRHAELVGELEALVAEQPLRERLRAALMLALYRSGRQAEALEAFQQGRRVLVEELGIEPGAELQELHRAILNQDVSLALAFAQKPTRERRLSLPSPATPLIGRQEELLAICDLLLGGARLVTVTGAGGSGKSRLALEVATSLVPQYGQRVCFVRLAQIHEAKLLATTIMSALGISEVATEPPLATLKHSLQEQPLLLVLDNFEHLRDVAPVLAELLAECMRLTLLVTSRASLHLSGERVYPLDPLPLSQAIALFTERARAVRPDFVGDETVLTAICERLDCLPLALELAAARSRLLSPQELLTRLEHRLELLTGGPRDLSDRQQTLRATIDWSYELLEQEEQQRFACLAVFTGGCTLGAAERVCSASLDQLDSLVDMNLLKRREAAGEGRFWMLGTIREHALERLEARGEAEGLELRRRHAEYFLGFAEEARGFARGPREIEWFDRIELELDNIRTALAWAVERPEGALGLRLVEALEPYWYRRSHLREGLLWLESLLELGAAAPPAIRAGALGLAGRLAFELGGEDARVRPWYEEGLVLARASGDRTREAWALHGLGALAWREDDLDLARNLFEQSLELFVELDEHGPAGGRLSYLGELALQAGDTDAARNYFERSIEEYAAAGDDSGVVGSMAGVAEVALVEGDFDAALRSYCAVLPRTTEPTDLGWILAGLAAAAAATGRAGEAARLWGASQRLQQEIDHPMSPVERGRYEKHLGSLDERQVAAGSALATADVVALGLRLLGHAPTK